ncbi:MAG: sulfate adenylyltransferase subunit CysN, partial [Odoribacter sp.]|nr:sulfate adenylyltransferase subunit CysN [Odoribacter sp.]
KHTTNLARVKIDKIRYKVNVTTLEQSPGDTMELNEIARVILSTGKPLFFDPYQKNKNTGAFILIDPITNNTCAVGMIIDKVEMKEMQEFEIPEINLTRLGISPEHHEAVKKVVNELNRQGIAVKLTE